MQPNISKYVLRLIFAKIRTAVSQTGPRRQTDGRADGYTKSTKLYQLRTQEFCSLVGGRVQQIQLMSEDRENGDLRAVAP